MQIAVAAVAAAGGAGAWLFAVPEPRPPAERLTEALALLDENPPPLHPSDAPGAAAARAARTRAAALALPLIAPAPAGDAAPQPPPLPDFPGAAAYVVGLETCDRAGDDPAAWAAAAAYLLRAEREGAPAARRRRLLAAAGLALNRAGRPSLALPRLRAALDGPAGTDGPPAVPLLVALADAAVTDGRPAALDGAADRLAAADAGSLPPPDAAALHRARGEVALARGDAEAAADALAAIGPHAAAAPLAVRLALLGGDPAAARAALPPAPRFPGPADAEILFLHGRVAEAAGDRPAAITHYRAAAVLAEAGPAALAARLAEARLLTDAGRFEEAAGAFAAAVAAPAGAAGGSSGDLRAELRRACAAASERGAADRCAALCDAAEPVLGAAEARRLKAEALADAVPAAAPVRVARAFAAWAAVEPDLARRRAARLSAADGFRAAGDPAAALAQLASLPPASDPDPGGLRLKRAELLLDSGDAAAARAAAEALVRDLPADPAGPAARALIGRAALEAGDPAAADAAWAAVLTDPDLTPAAAEWRASLFSRADLAAGLALAAVPPLPDPAAEEGDAADTALAAAADLLGECLARYPDDPAAGSVRLRRGRCRLARRQRLDAAAPAGDPLTARNRRERANTDLAAALADFRSAEDGLRANAEAAAPSPADAARLRLARLGAAECLSRLGRTEAGAVAIAAAVDRDPLSLRSAAALLDLAAARRAAGDAVGGTLAAEQARQTAARLPDAAFTPTASPLTRAQWDRLFLLARRAPPAADPGSDGDPPPAPPTRDAAP